MAQEYRSVLGWSFESESGATFQAAIGSGDGALYLQASFPGEHGKVSRPKSMKVENWQRICENAASIEGACNDLVEYRGRARKLEAQKAMRDTEIDSLNKVRDVIGEEAHAVAVKKIKAKYPELEALKA